MISGSEKRNSFVTRLYFHSHQNLFHESLNHKQSEKADIDRIDTGTKPSI
jgi:hypothetical protein